MSQPEKQSTAMALCTVWGAMLLMVGGLLLHMLLCEMCKKEKPRKRKRRRRRNRQRVDIRDRTAYICDDVLLDCFPFLEREQHLALKLVNRRFFHLSTSAHTAKRYPKATLYRFFISKAKSNDFRRSVVGSQIRGYSKHGRTCFGLEFPDEAPPAHILPFRGSIYISDCVGPEVLQFLRFSSASLIKCCNITFHDFANFTEHYSVQFFAEFLALFPSICSISFIKATRNHESYFSYFAALSGRINRIFLHECADDFSLECLLGWMHTHNPMNGPTDRWLYVLNWHNEKAIRDFANEARKEFLSASQTRPFHVWFGCDGGLSTPTLMFQEHNAQTGETLTLYKHGSNNYALDRRQVPGQQVAAQSAPCPNTEHPYINVFEVS